MFSAKDIQELAGDICNYFMVAKDLEKFFDCVEFIAVHEKPLIGYIFSRISLIKDNKKRSTPTSTENLTDQYLTSVPLLRSYKKEKDKMTEAKKYFDTLNLKLPNLLLVRNYLHLFYENSFSLRFDLDEFLYFYFNLARSYISINYIMTLISYTGTKYSTNVINVLINFLNENNDETLPQLIEHEETQFYTYFINKITNFFICSAKNLIKEIILKQLIFSKKYILNFYSFLTYLVRCDPNRMEISLENIIEHIVNFNTLPSLEDETVVKVLRLIQQRDEHSIRSLMEKANKKIKPIYPKTFCEEALKLLTRYQKIMAPFLVKTTLMNFGYLETFYFSSTRQNLIHLFEMVEKPLCFSKETRTDLFNNKKVIEDSIKKYDSVVIKNIVWIIIDMLLALKNKNINPVFKIHVVDDVESHQNIYDTAMMVSSKILSRSFVYTVTL